MTVIATTAAGQASFEVSNPPRPGDLTRWAGVASLPGLADAVWSVRPGPLRAS